MHRYAPIRKGLKRVNALLLLALGMLCWSMVLAQPPQRQTTEEYIEQYKDLAISEMYRTGIPASVTIAQGILESGSGNSRLAKEGNNHFGIKCHEGWNGESIYEDDDAAHECFRKYQTAYESYIDHSEFLMSRERYAFLFDYDRTDYEKWAHGLKKAGYATNPKYAPLLISLIERFNLQQYDVAPPPIDPNPVVAENNENPDEPNHNTNHQKRLPTGIFYTNRIKTVFMQPGQTLAFVAKQQDVRLSRLERYNEVDEGYVIEPGMKVFLQPKRNKAANQYHKVQDGETLYMISQMHGIKMRQLLKYNLLDKGQEVADGERLYLRSSRDHPPKLRREDYTPASNVLAEKPNTEPAPKQEKPESKEESKQPVATTIDTVTINPEPEHQSDIAEVAAQEEETQQEVKPIEPDKPKYTYVPQDGEDAHMSAENEATDPLTDELKDYRTLDPMAENTEQEAAKTQPDQPEDSADYIYHEVQQGDTLYSLSRKYGTSVQQLQQWNQLGEPNIKIGQSLIVGVGNSM